MTPSSPVRPLRLLLPLLVLTAASPALGAPKRAGVPKFEGQEEALVRKQVMQVLRAKGYDLVKSREIEVALANTGALLDSDEGFAKVAKELALAVIVTGEIGKKRAKIVAHDGRDGSVLGQAVFTGPNPRKIAAEVGRDLWKKLGDDIQRGKAPSGAKKPQKSAVAEAPEDDESTPAGEADAAPTPEPRKSKKAAAGDEPVATVESGDDEAAPKKKKKKRKKVKLEEEEAEEGDGGGGGLAVVPATFDAALGTAGINRSFSYNDSIAGLRPYSLPLGPALAASLAWYPLGFITDGPLQQLGFDLRLEHAFLVSSSLPPEPMTPGGFPNGATFGTSVHEYSGGLRYRLPFGPGHQAFFGLGGGEHAFLFTTQNSTDMTMSRGNLDIPDTIYRFMRAGAGARFEVATGWSVSVGAGYRAILNGAGKHVGQYFPHRSVGGVDAQAAVGYQLTEDLEVRGGVDYRRYFYSMNSQCAMPSTDINVCDRYVAGGALDQYLTFTAVIAYRFGGSAAEGPPEGLPDAPRKQKARKASDGESSEGEIGATD